jgi:hypothetical protein
MTQHEQIMAKYMRERKISFEYAKAAGIRAVDANTADLMGFPYARRSQGGIVFPYFNPLNGKQHPNLMRIRYLGEVPHDDAGKAVRYTQPRGSDVEAFFDANVNWLKLMRDPNRPIVITEGEAKALSLNQHTEPLGSIVAIALGGVWNFREKATGDLTPWLRMIRASSGGVGRKIVIVFDSDMADNPSIQAAAAELSRLMGIEVQGGMSICGVR